MRDQSSVNQKFLSCYSIAFPFSSGDVDVINIRYPFKFYIYFFSDYVT